MNKIFIGLIIIGTILFVECGPCFPGPPGPPGNCTEPCVNGTTPTITIGNTTTGEPGTNANVTNSGNNTDVILNFLIPEGEMGATGSTGPIGPTGPQGPQGDAATVNVGNTTTLPAGSNAMVTNVGTTSDAIFDFYIPQGIQGIQGNPGESAAQLCVNVTCPETTKTGGCQIYTCISGFPCQVTGIVPDCCAADTDCDTFMPCFMDHVQDLP